MGRWMIAGAAVLLAAAASPDARAQDAAERAGTQPAAAQPAKWVVRCSNVADANRLACRMSQSLVDGRTRARVLTVSVVPGAAPRMRIALPHGTNLLKGVTLSVDGGQGRTVAISTADANGAYAVVPVDAPLLASLRAGRAMRVAFASSAGRDIALDVDLSGFSAALDLATR